MIHGATSFLLGEAIKRLDALAEADEKPRLYLAPADERRYWAFTDTRVLFRFPCDYKDALVWPSDYSIDLARWACIEPTAASVLSGHDRQGLRRTQTAIDWRRELARANAPREPVSTLDVLWFYPAAVAFDLRLFRLAMLPALATEPIVVDAAANEPLWLHGAGWSAAVAPLRTPLGTVNSECIVHLLPMAP